MSDPGGNLWTHSAEEAVSAPPLNADTHADLVVIGGGYTGCAAALEAARQGAKVVLLEAETIGHGGSGRNVGLVNAGLWLPPDEIVKALGADAGGRLIDALGRGPQMVVDLIARHGIDCEGIRNGTLHLAHGPTGLDDLRNRFRQGNRHGAPLQLLDRAETARRTGTAAFHGALFDPRAGTIQPLAYCRGIARAAQDAGAALHGRSPVERIAREAEAWCVTAGGHSVRAGALLLATNAYHRAMKGIAAPQFIRVNYCQFATAPLPPSIRARILPGGEGCWDTAMVMSSVRTDRAGRLIVGGMGDSEGFGGRAHKSWARRKLASLFPDIAEAQIEHEWSGHIAMTSDHIPKILDIGPNALAVFGYSGRGISPGTVFGTAAARSLLRQGASDALPVQVQDRHIERFSVARSYYYEIGATLAHGISAATGR